MIELKNICKSFTLGGETIIGTSTEVMDLLQKLNEEGQTIILITHDINVAKKAKRIVRIADGKMYEGEVI